MLPVLRSRSHRATRQPHGPERVSNADGPAAPPIPSAADPPSRPPADRRGLTLTLIAVLASIAVLWWARVWLITLVLGVLLSYALEPLQRRLVAWGVPRVLAASLLLTSLAGAAAGSGYLLRFQAAAFMSQLPLAAQRVRTFMRDGRGAIEQVQQAATELKRAADESAPAPERGVTRVRVDDPGIRVADLLWRGSFSAVEVAIQITIVMFLVFYLLAYSDLYKRKVLRIAGPSISKKRVTLEILNQITEQIERFLLARVVISVMVGAATAIAFWVLGVSSPAVWGIGAGVLNTVPYVGPSVVAVAAAAAGFLQFGTGGMALLLGGTAVGIACVEGFLVTPWLMGRASRMNAGAVFVCLSFWGWIWGVWGVLLAVPIMMVIKAICDHIQGWNPVSELLSE